MKVCLEADDHGNGVIGKFKAEINVLESSTTKKVCVYLGAGVTLEGTADEFISMSRAIMRSIDDTITKEQRTT